MKKSTNNDLAYHEMDQVLIESLQVDAVIGVYDWERTITQPLIIDAIIYADQQKAAQSDDINHAINYKKVCEDIISSCQRTKANLIERLADNIANIILSYTGVKKVSVSVKKPTAIKETQSVGVRIVRYADK